MMVGPRCNWTSSMSTPLALRFFCSCSEDGVQDNEYNNSDEYKDSNDYDDPDDHALGRPGGFSVFLSALSLFSRPHPPPHSSLLQSITLEIHIYVYTFTHLMCGQWRIKHIFIYIFFRTLLFLLGSDTPLAVAKYLVYATRARHVSYCCCRYPRLPPGNPLCLETTEAVQRPQTAVQRPQKAYDSWKLTFPSCSSDFYEGLNPLLEQNIPAPCDSQLFSCLFVKDLFINTTNMVPF